MHPWRQPALTGREKRKLNNYNRRRTIQRHTPGWADPIKIKEVYALASAQGKTVDHIVPLTGSNVSGLHVEYNLQILSRQANSIKKNYAR